MYILGVNTSPHSWSSLRTNLAWHPLQCPLQHLDDLVLVSPALGLAVVL